MLVSLPDSLLDCGPLLLVPLKVLLDVTCSDSLYSPLTSLPQCTSPAVSLDCSVWLLDDD